MTNNLTYYGTVIITDAKIFTVNTLDPFVKIEKRHNGSTSFNRKTFVLPTFSLLRIKVDLLTKQGNLTKGEGSVQLTSLY